MAGTAKRFFIGALDHTTDKVLATVPVGKTWIVKDVELALGVNGATVWISLGGSADSERLFYNDNKQFKNETRQWTGHVVLNAGETINGYESSLVAGQFAVIISGVEF